MFSVVIPLYNKQDSVKNTIKSVLNQSYNDFEVVVVNDGSTDKSEQCVLEFLDPRIRIINKKNGGISSARNRGIDEANYEYIAFLDADDVWDPDYLLEQKKMIYDFPQASMWGLGYAILTLDKKAENIQTNLPQESRGIVRNYFSRNNKATLFCSSSVVISKQVFVELDPFDQRQDIGEDVDMWFRIILEKDVAFYNRVYAYYNQGAENRAMAQKKPDLKKTIQFYIEKYDDYKPIAPDAISFIHSFCAGALIPYYFGDRKERMLAKTITPKFDYPQIHRKYYLFYKTPYLVGLFFYLLFLSKKHS